MSLAALLFSQLDLVDPWTQTNIDDILCHGNRMSLHALTNKMVAIGGNLTEQCCQYCLNYSKFYQGHIDCSFCGEAGFD